ncbi:FAD-dependent oxidoreductase [Verminephrobacter aporrectodeae subsp. tuberculatae]|uniref:FAD-dependent oxidoreductase n=1 Tax=Verminephrobacter aporrectodeae TaxID=1110389 RepID=UPI002238C740|nr:FAD-dependent oxidoreductase [Verminephrobacter aporrectodeae]MCW5222535.1 FAD-dependent oxidoreductase [Verminephrobacter aporrectodeae subsp. tuberculatae]MCW5288000.1 FAD-dependent oxidoreductase [Verminephrobacter aporrectodeae subsp. tuberculatae]
MSLRPSSFAILGAGLMGRLLAVELARQGHRVDVFDAGSAAAEHSAARVAAAMLAPLAESAITTPGVVRMGRHALGRWPQLLAALADPVFFQQAGTLVVWHRQDAAEARRFTRQLEACQRLLPELPALRRLDGQALAQAEPALADRFAQGLYLPGEGQLDNRQLLAALATQLERLAVRVHWHTPQSPAGLAPGAAGQPDWVLDCRGLGAKAEWPALRGVRGEVARVHAPDVTLQRPTRLLHPRYPIYIAPKEEHLFVIGATEIESDELSPASVRSTLELLSAAYAVHPGFAEGRILELAVQCRPALPDNLPAIRQPRKGVLEINGLYRHGFMIAPALLDVTLELLNTGQSALAQDFDLALAPAPGPAQPPARRRDMDMTQA